MLASRILIFFLTFLVLPHVSDASEWDLVPIAYQGRFRPLDAASRLWLYQLTHRQSIKPEYRQSLQSPKGDAKDLLLAITLNGHRPFDNTPLFYIHEALIKNALGLPLKTDLFSYDQIKPRIYEDKSSLQPLRSLVAQYEQWNKAASPLEERFISTWHFLKAQGTPVKDIAKALESEFPLRERLRQTGSLLRALPSRYQQGEWFSLKALDVAQVNPLTDNLEPVGNFTSYPDDQFNAIRNAYFALENALLINNPSVINKAKEKLGRLLNDSYRKIAGTPYLEVSGKALHYPTNTQLKAEVLYYKLPLIEITILAYSLALICFLFAYTLNASGLYLCSTCFLLIAFILHTAILALRCYILGRPPVSNMFETVVYVPWISVLTSLILTPFMKNRFLLIASALVSVSLLIVLYVSETNHELENVQAVLDSQYWLIVHVLMVVGSYGAFALCGMLGHLYLAYPGKETPQHKFLAKAILQTMYLGVALLIPGTILGGVWAAESWGRFWDWDPKESWAFISSCVYLIWIHAYRFNRIGNFGLAIGSIIGLMAISFTWYGVNYILGTGMHSYGFGNGGEMYYYIYGISELFFIGTCSFLKKSHLSY